MAELGADTGGSDLDQMRGIAGLPDGFTIALETDDEGTTTRREEWFYYEIRTVFEFVDGRLVSNLPIESKYGQFYLAPVQYDPATIPMGVSWEELAEALPDPGSLVRYELEPEYDLDGSFYVGNQLLAFFDDNGLLIYLEALPLAPDEE
jgi:hypothetical protein